ncbi:SpoIIE family protein phosphatase, partial [bacterium]|nr:SpoIIE family protein phosphatase [bacterium]
LAIAFALLQSRLQGWFERVFFPEKTRLNKALKEFLDTTGTLPSRQAFWDNLEEKLREGLQIDGLIPLMAREGGRTFTLADGTEIPVDLDGELVGELRRKNRPLVVDEVTESGRVELATDEEQWLRERKVNLLLPLFAHARLIGMLALQKSEDKAAFEAEDLGILLNISSRIALESENLRLREEMVGKERLEQEMSTARRVQQGFLPAELPETPGLQVAGRCIPSYEVAGDYYDVIALPEGQTLLAIGDVSGKGAAAALLMASLQASLRSISELGLPLHEVVSRVNRQVFRSTDPEQYITFFAAIYHPETRQLTYVNAGHNNPRVIRQNGTTEELDVGGPPLGVLQEWSYDAGTCKCREGDLLVGFTDGVSEAMDANEEEYGEERIVTVLRDHESIDGESDGGLDHAIKHIYNSVRSFSGHSRFEDDFTLLLCRAM